MLLFTTVGANAMSFECIAFIYHQIRISRICPEGVCKLRYWIKEDLAMIGKFRHRKVGLFVVAACALMGTTAVQAGLGFRAGDWDLDFSGNVNGFATWNSCDNKSFNIAGGLACNKGPEGSNTQSVESGLLPSALVFSAKSRQMNLDVGVTIGLYPTLRTNPGDGSGNTALGSSSINVRQNFLFFGDKTWGQVKVGRDIGIFASDAILNDMTLLGVGSGAAFLGGSTTLGRIGVGYIYTDWIPQITYSSPDFNGVKFAVGVFQGLDDEAILVGTDPNAATLTHHDSPGFQGKVTYEWKAPVSGKAWFSAMDQQAKSGANQFGPNTGVKSITGTAWDIGAKINYADLDAVGYYYNGEGVGTTAIGFGAASFAKGTLDKRKSDGYYGQLTYKFGLVKLGYSYGASNLKYASNESTATNPRLLRKNSSSVFGVYYALTPSLNLVGEYIMTKAQAQNDDSIKDNAFALGAILFF
jgi:predicted porin